MRTVQLNAETLTPIAQQLGDNWRYNAIMSNDPDYRGHYLSNGAGLFIEVKYVYGEALPQWELCYKHPTYKRNLVRFTWIGCSLKKSRSAIIADLKNRLLSHVTEAYQALAKLTAEEAEKRQAEQLDQYVIQSLEKVLRLNPYHDHRYSQAYRIENEDGTRIASLMKWSRQGDCFRLDIDGLTAAKIIKIMEIVSE